MSNTAGLSALVIGTEEVASAIVETLRQEGCFIHFESPQKAMGYTPEVNGYHHHDLAVICDGSLNARQLIKNIQGIPLLIVSDNPKAYLDLSNELTYLADSRNPEKISLSVRHLKARNFLRNYCPPPSAINDS